MDDEYVEAARISMEGLGLALTPGAYLGMQIFPMLRHIPSWVPGTSGKRVAEKYAPYLTKMVEDLYSEVKTARVRSLLHSLEKGPLNGRTIPEDFVS